MSTNYYWIYEEPKPQFIKLPTGTKIKCHDAEVPYDGTHVGKRYGCGDAQTAFIFATDPALIFRTLDAYIGNGHSHVKIIEDEYGRQFNAPDFSVLLYDNLRWEIQSIGTRFC